MELQAPQEVRSDLLLGHWHPPSQTMASFASGWRSPRGSLKSSSGSAGTATEEVGIVTGAGSCAASSFPGNMGKHGTDLAVRGEGRPHNLPKNDQRCITQLPTNMSRRAGQPTVRDRVPRASNFQETTDATHTGTDQSMPPFA